MYMREMGSVELLDREGEIRIAKRIEEGLNEAMFAMAQYPETVAILLEAYENSKLGKKRLADIITGFIDPNAAATPPTPPAPVVKAEADARDNADESDEKEKDVEPGPDPPTGRQPWGERVGQYVEKRVVAR